MISDLRGLASAEEDIYDVVDEPLAGELQGVPLNIEEMEPSRFIQGLQADAVLDIDRRLSEGQDDVGLARRVELKVLRLSGFDHPVLVVLHQHKVLKGGKVDGIGLVLDFCDELALLHVSVKVERVMPVLGLNQDLLDEVNVGAIVEQIPDDVTEEVHLTGALREPKDPLVLRAKRDQVLHGWTWAPLGNSPKELPSLGKPDGVVASGQLSVLSDHLAHLPDLSVGIPEEATLGVCEQVASDHDPVDVHAGDVLLQDVCDPDHASGTVPHPVPKDHWHRSSIVSVRNWSGRGDCQKLEE